MSAHDQQTKVALFPVPEMVCFPGTQTTLHVFEPRYRAMVRHCIENNLMLAVSHTKKAINKESAKSKPLSSNDSLADVMASNQTSYEPHETFSAGPLELLEETEDGRMYINITFIDRLQWVATQQEVPFKVVLCKRLSDAPDEDPATSELLAKRINDMLLHISQSHSPKLHELMKQPEWENMTPTDFSYQLFTYFKFHADFMQTVLEQPSTEARLSLIWQGLNEAFQS